MSKNRYVVIMAGGRGERFWPQSRLRKPKHLLPIVGNSPMLAQTVDRLSGLVSASKVFVITNAEQRDAVLESCPGLLPERVIGEPEGRDTAAAVGLAALLVEKTYPGAAFALLPADHVIADAEGFRKVLEGAFEAAEKNDFLVTIGIKPDFPSTGYGYLKQGEPVEPSSSLPVHQVERFVEKPNLEHAGQYLQEGGYFGTRGCCLASWCDSRSHREICSRIKFWTRSIIFGLGRDRLGGAGDGKGLPFFNQNFHRFCGDGKSGRCGHAGICF